MRYITRFFNWNVLVSRVGCDFQGINVLYWPLNELNLSSLGYYLHKYFTNIAISTWNNLLNFTQPPQASGVVFITNSHNLSWLEGIGTLTLLACTMKLSKLLEVLQLPAFPEVLQRFCKVSCPTRVGCRSRIILIICILRDCTTR